MQRDKEFPQEYRIELLGLSPFLEGRVTIEQQQVECYSVEVNIVQTESGKIYNHVIIVYEQDDPREALNLGVHHLKKYLERKTN